MQPRILIVDDEPDILKLIERIISEKTHNKIITTNSSLEVPKLLEDNTFDIIMTDLKMPGMDGLDILKYVKNKGRKELVIIFTAFGTLETAVEAMSLGVFDYIAKPFKKEQILDTVERAIQHQKKLNEIEKFESILETEPFVIARQSFFTEYFSKLARKYKSNDEKIAAASGLPLEFVKTELNKFMFRKTINRSN